MDYVCARILTSSISIMTSSMFVGQGGHTGPHPGYEP
jgi:hypothetical protein